jgi:hypothetical protein
LQRIREPPMPKSGFRDVRLNALNRRLQKQGVRFVTSQRAAHARNFLWLVVNFDTMDYFIYTSRLSLET